MQKKLIISFIFIFVSTMFLMYIFPSFENISYQKENKEKARDTSYYSELGAFRDSAYYRTYSEWLTKYNIINLENELEFTLDACTTNSSNDSLNYSNDNGLLIYNIEKEQTLEVVIEAPETGLYELGFSYKPQTDFTSEPYIGIKINGKTPFNEISNIPLEVTWSLQKRTEDNRYNRYGNELLPYSLSLNEWYKTYLTDSNSRYATPYKVLLNEGSNNISIQNLASTLQLSKVFLNNSKEKISYENYIKKYQNTPVINNLITIDAENFAYKNNIEIKASYYKDPSMTPCSYKTNVLNILDGSSSSRGGSAITYKFDVDKAGMYRMTFKYLQNTLAGLTCSKAIYVDGEIPFKEFECYQFFEERNWSNHTLNSNNQDYYIYLSEGEHTLSLRTTLVQYNDYIEKLYSIMDAINNLGLTISSITGSSTNKFTDWNILKYLPNIVEELNGYADDISEIYDKINAMNPLSNEASEISTLNIASKQLRRLTERPNRIHMKLSQLNSGSGSAYQLIGTAIGILLNQPISFDTIYLSAGDVAIPKARSNFFTRIWFSIKSFIYSFFDERNKVSTNKDDGVLEVWVAQSNLYLDIIQSMTDDEFTKETGIDVKISILPSSQKIVLNNATNTNPDVVLSIDSWEPYNYALRGILEDLSTYEGFDDITKNIYSNCFTPVIYDKGVYAIPETQGLNIMFYRKDILEYLELEVPRTWDDVIKILPILQSYQMNFYHPLGSDSSYKNYSSTTPFIYAFGGEVFSDNGMETVLKDEKVISAIQYMTDLFNVYNLPQQVSSFFEHFRSGTLPIGIGTLDMYLQLKYASPELSGQWGIVQVPGFDMNNDGEVESWTTAYGKSSILFKSSHMKQEAWEFIKWWNSTKVQTEYSQNIKMCLGEKYLIIPANVDALEASPWDQEIKTNVSLAAKWSRIPAVLPGSYVVEREFSNIWNKVVIDLVDVRVAVGQSVDKVNRELRRKFEEFHYIKDGEIIKEYVVPNNNNIHNWVKGKEYYE